MTDRESATSWENCRGEGGETVPSVPAWFGEVTIIAHYLTGLGILASAKIGVTRGAMVYELFYTALPQEAFTPADVVDLYLHRGAFECVLSDEDQEQDPDRWCSHKWARPSFTGGFPGSAFTPQPDGTLRCPADRPLYPQEHRPERDGSLRVLYAARIGHCRSCSLRAHCQESATTIKARRVSAVYWAVSSPASISDGSLPAPGEPSPPSASCPVLWGDWQRRSHRREVVKLLRHQRIDIRLTDISPPAQLPPVRPLSRAERAHYRLSWKDRLARNARSEAAPDVSITLFGIPDAFATSLGLQTA